MAGRVLTVQFCLERGDRCFGFFQGAPDVLAGPLGPAMSATPNEDPDAPVVLPELGQVDRPRLGSHRTSQVD
ncbi:MAG: hypothetical protein ABSA91_15235 [Acidimicrobiales bacterium]